MRQMHSNTRRDCSNMKMLSNYFIWLVPHVVGCLALNSQSDLETAWLSTITGQSHIESSGPISYDFAQGRATNYAYNQAGSCGCALPCNCMPIVVNMGIRMLSVTWPVYVQLRTNFSG